jgi:hypothetical protein
MHSLFVFTQICGESNTEMSFPLNIHVQISVMGKPRNSMVEFGGGGVLHSTKNL